MPDAPAVNVVLSALVMAGAWSTVSVKVCVASVPHAVVGGDRERVGAAGARVGRAGQGGGAVAVVHESHAPGQRAGLAQGRGREAAGGDGERAQRWPVVKVVRRRW